MSIRSIAAPVALAIAITFSASAHAAAKFTQWHGKDEALQGEGGEMEEIEGVQLWTNGDPPRSFKILGYISDTRLSTGLIGKMRVKNRNKEIAKVAKANGGDAVIFVNTSTTMRGHVWNKRTSGHLRQDQFSSTTTEFGSPVQNESTRYAVIKYIPTSATTPAD